MTGEGNINQTDTCIIRDIFWCVKDGKISHMNVKVHDFILINDDKLYIRHRVSGIITGDKSVFFNQQICFGQIPYHFWKKNQCFQFCPNIYTPKWSIEQLSLILPHVSENTGKFLRRDLAALTNSIYCSSQRGTLINRFINNYDDAYWLGRISYNFLI